MAYVFSDLKSGVEGDDDPNKQSIFGGESGGEQAPMMQGGVAPKTSTEGDFGSYSSGVGGSSQLKSAPEPDAVDQSAVFDRNIGQTETPSGLGGLQSQIKKSSDDLQTQADAYTAGYQKDYDYQVENAALDNAIAGGQEDYKKTEDFLSKLYADEAKKFDPSGLRVRGAQDLETDAGLQKLAGQGQGPQYTQGMGAFDVMLMKRDPKFNAMLNQIRGENITLNESLGVKPGELETAAQDYGQSALTTEQDRIKDYLGDYSTDMIAANEKELGSYQDELGGLDRAAIEQQEVDSYDFANSLGDEYQQDYAGVLKDYDPSKFMQYDTGEDYTWQDFLNKTEAGGLNMAGGLLGKSDTYSEALGPRDKYTVDKSGMWDDIFSKTKGAYGKRQIAEEEERIKVEEEERIKVEEERIRVEEEERIKVEEERIKVEEEEKQRLIDEQKLIDEEEEKQRLIDEEEPQNIKEVWEQQDGPAGTLTKNLFKNLKAAVDPVEAVKGGEKFYRKGAAKKTQELSDVLKNLGPDASDVLGGVGGKVVGKIVKQQKKIDKKLIDSSRDIGGKLRSGRDMLFGKNKAKSYKGPSDMGTDLTKLGHGAAANYFRNMSQEDIDKILASIEEARRL